MPNSSVNVIISMDANVKAKTDALFESLGLDMPTAINLFIRQCLVEQKLPFQPSSNVPNKTTIKAIEEANEMIRTGNFNRYTVDEAFEALKKDT